jgi:hypothetical protein
MHYQQRLRKPGREKNLNYLVHSRAGEFVAIVQSYKWHVDMLIHMPNHLQATHEETI